MRYQTDTMEGKLSDCNKIQTNNHLICKLTLNRLTKRLTECYQRLPPSLILILKQRYRFRKESMNPLTSKTEPFIPKINHKKLFIANSQNSIRQVRSGFEPRTCKWDTSEILKLLKVFINNTLWKKHEQQNHNSPNIQKR